MLMLSFYLSIVNFFMPKKYKEIIGRITIGIIAVFLLDYLIPWSFIPYYFQFGHQLDLFAFLYSRVGYFLGFHGRFIVTIIFYLLRFGLAFAGMNYSLIKYKSDDSYQKNSVVITNSSDNNALYRVVEVNAGLFTGTLRAGPIESVLNQMAENNWKFERMESIIGRCCLFFPRYKAIICFSKNK